MSSLFQLFYSNYILQLFADTIGSFRIAIVD